MYQDSLTYSYVYMCLPSVYALLESLNFLADIVVRDMRTLFE